jgi:ABC-type sugar transport system ATPase subunit
MADPALLEIEHIGKRFPGVQALDDVSLTLAAGEVHGLVGQNGAGKSTLVKCITGVYPPDSGRIVLEGEPITAYMPKHAYDLGIAVVHQRTQLIPWLSVAENVLLGHLPTYGGAVILRGEANRITRDLLERFRLELDPETMVARLAPPERQQVAIARALFRRAKLLILDEPTAALDAERAERLFELIGDLKEQGVGVLYVSHHLEEEFRLADRITVLRDGKIVATRPVGELDQTEVVTLMAGRRLENGLARGAANRQAEGEPLLELDGVSNAFLQGVELSIRAGEVVGVTGVVGAGGHDLARALFGLEPLSAGTIRLVGKPYVPQGPRQAIARGLFLVPEDPTGDGLVPVLSVAQNITLVDLPGITRGGLLSLKQERAIAERYVDELSIATGSIDTPVRNLSGGNQQKVLVAKALALGAQMLVLEEPTQGVDVHATAEIHRIVRSLADGGKAVMVISTDIRDLLQFVDRVVALRGGRVVADLPAGETDYAHMLDLTVGSLGAVA